jgi:3-hydroxybutyrate dehydrogenase
MNGRERSVVPAGNSRGSGAVSNISFDFSSERILITGASRGIGYGIAEAFARAGADLILLAESDDIFGAAKRLSDQGSGRIQAVKCDIADPRAVARELKDIERVDVLINNAGLELITPLADMSESTEAAFRRIFDINLLGTYYVTRAIVPKMEEGARILFTASIWSRVSVPEFGAYCASKHAVLGLMRSLAGELGPKGIRVNAVCPGWVRTEASMRSLREMSSRTRRREEDLLAEITGNQVFSGLLEPDDVAPFYLYLASDAAANMTGQALMADRGEVMA